MVYGENTINRKMEWWKADAQVRGAGWTPVGKYTLIDLVQIILYITYTIDTIYAYKNYPSIVSRMSRARGQRS